MCVYVCVVVCSCACAHACACACVHVFSLVLSVIIMVKPDILHMIYCVAFTNCFDLAVIVQVNAPNTTI